MTALRNRLARIQVFLTRSIWQTACLTDRSLRGRLLSALRIAALTCSGVIENALASRAGALSYSSMLAIGPLVILVVLFSGSVAARTDGDFALQQLNRALLFIAPQLAQLQSAPPTPAGDAAATGSPGPAAEDTLVITSINPELAAMLRGLVGQTHSRTIGLIGIVSLIVIVIQLFTSIENAFNGIWGVRRGRNWLLRIVYYWAAVTLGAVVAVSALAVLSAATFVSVVDSLPFASGLRQLFAFTTPLISATILAALLALFYKFIPNTAVGWIPAFTGAVIAVVLIQANNTLAFLYIRSVSLNLSIYGGLAVLVVLMLGLYVFWLILLVGGQITYAVQNAHYRGSNIAWADLHHTARLGIAVLVLTLVARRFRACRPAYTAAEIAEIARIPIQILNACFMRLIRLGVVSRIPPEDAGAGLDHRFQPARPLGSITLAEFKALFEDTGEGPDHQILGAIDPVVQQFFERSRTATEGALGSETLEAIIDRMPESPAAAG